MQKLIIIIFFLISTNTYSFREKVIENSLWVQASYLLGYTPSVSPPYQAFAKNEIIELSENLKNNNIHEIYIYAGPYQKDGTIPYYYETSISQKNLKLIKELSPATEITPWLGGIQFKQVFLSDEIWRKNAIENTTQFIKRNQLKSIHINFEYLLFEIMPDNNINYLENFELFFKELRNQNPKTKISTVVTSTLESTKSWKIKHTPESLINVGRFIDTLSVLFYDTGINSPEKYESEMQNQINDFKKIKKANPHIKLLMGVGTFENLDFHSRHYRDQKIENIESNLLTLRKLYSRIDNSYYIDGIAIFCEWQTDISEWMTINRYWSQISSK